MEQDIQATPVTRLVCSKCGHEMDVSGREPFTSVACEQCQSTLTVPMMLGSFALLKKMGAGGMGSVYRALDTALNRFVAIKVMKASLGEDNKLVQSFIREAQAAAALNHRNIVQIYSCGQERGQPYIVMELVTGGKMNQMFSKEEPMEEVQLLKIALDVAEGLSAANGVGLVHGDIKPENVLVDGGGTAKIVDFGLAQFVNAQKDRGEIWGTPYYISPERARGNKADHRSDIYSLGATMFHALAGIPPFEGATPVDVVLARLKFPPPALDHLRPGLQPQTIRLIERMMAPDPYLRYPTSASLKSDMCAALDAASVAKKGGGGAKKKKQRSNLPSIIIAAVAVLVVLGAGVAIMVNVTSNQKPPAPAPAQKEPSQQAVKPVDPGKKPGEEVVDVPSPPKMVEKQIRLLNQVFALTVPEPVGQFMAGDSSEKTMQALASFWPTLMGELRAFKAGTVAVGRGDFKAAQEAFAPLLLGTPHTDAWIEALREVARSFRMHAQRVEDAEREVRRRLMLFDTKGAKDFLDGFEQVAPELAVPLKALHKEIAEREQEQRLTRQVEADRAHRVVVQKDLDRVDVALGAISTEILRNRDFRRAALMISTLYSELDTKEGKQAARQMRATVERLDQFKAFLIRSTDSVPYTRADGCDLNGDVVSASLLGVRVTLDGRSVITHNWDDLPLRSLVRMAEFYATNNRISEKERAEGLTGLALFYLMNGAFDAAVHYAGKAVELDASQAAALRVLMPGVVP